MMGLSARAFQEGRCMAFWEPKMTGRGMGGEAGGEKCGRVFRVCLTKLVQMK
jgi:hypothetical protein